MVKFNEQIDVFRYESTNYFQRNYECKDLRSLPLNRYLENILSKYSLSIVGGSVLDIGCCPGSNLYQLVSLLKAKRGVGTDPSQYIVNRMVEAFPELEFQVNDSRQLPFTTGEFDLVVPRSVLHWIDRNYLLQTIGEAIRVSKKFLLISDFAPTFPYAVIYHHQPACRTFKIGYQPLLEASGFVRCVVSSFDDRDDEWLSVQTCIYEKLSLEEAFPVRSQEDFK